MIAGCVGDASGDADEGSENVRPAGRSTEDRADEWKWKVDYSGDLSGHIEGRSFVLVKTGPPAHLNFAVKTLSRKPGLTATLSVHDGKPTGFLTHITLEDGTSCAPADRSSVEVLDAKKATFHATVEGNMRCGEAKDRNIDFAAVIRER